MRGNVQAPRQAQETLSLTRKKRVRKHLWLGRQQPHSRRARLRRILQAAQAAQRLAQHLLALGARRAVHYLRRC